MFKRYFSNTVLRFLTSSILPLLLLAGPAMAGVAFIVLDDGSRLDLDVAAPIETAPGSYDLSAAISLTAAIPESEAVVFAFDTSYSTYLFGGNGTGCGGDYNGRRGPNDIIDCELASIDATVQAVAGLGRVADVGLVAYFGLADTLDVQPATGIQGLTSPDADLDGDGVPDLETVLRSVVIGGYPNRPSCADEFSQVCVANGSPGGQTDYSVGLVEACDLLASSSQPFKTMIFMSDGESTRNILGDIDTILPCGDVVVHTVALGAGSSCDEDPNGTGSLQEVADLGGGSCVEVNEPEDLSGALLQALIPQITRVTLSLDGGPEVDVSASVLEGLPYRGSGAVHLAHSVTGLAEGDHEFCVTAYAEGSTPEASGQVTECVDTARPNAAPIADAGPDLSLVEGDSFTLDGTASSDPDGDPLTYAWTLASAAGPPPLVPSSVLPTVSAQTLDDGVYTFELTVSDGELSATDTVVVTVVNADPTLSARADDATAGGVTLLTAALTDAGTLDTHTASVNWGDGSAEAVDLSAQGTGWGSLYASHVYDQPGEYTVTLTLVDDDGGSAEFQTSLTIGAAVAVWGDATSGDAIEFTGGDGTVDGWIHSNAGLRVGGANKQLTGRIEYVTRARIHGNVVVDPAPVQVAAAPRPVIYDVADYRPGGAAAIRAGLDYHDVSGDCVDGVWQPDTWLVQGLYYAACDVHLTAPALAGTLTVVAEGTIHVAGSGAVFAPYVDGLLFLSNDPGDRAIRVSGSGKTFLGFLYASVGGVQLSGADTRYLCGIVGETVDLSGRGLEVTAADCVRPARTTAPPTLVPHLELTLTNASGDTLPAELVTSVAAVSNTGALLLVPGIVGLENLGTGTVTVTAADVALEAFDLSTGLWTTVPGATTLSARAHLAAGVTYPPAPEPFAGTTLDPGALASWGAELQVELDPATLSWLLDPARVDAARMRVDFVLDDPAAPVRRLFRFGDDIAAELRAQGAGVASVNLTVATVDGQVHVRDAGTDSGLALLAPGDGVLVMIDADAPVPAPKSASESNNAYLSRLATLDGASLGALAYGRGDGGIGTLLAPTVIATTTLHLPVIEPAVSAPAMTTADAGLEVTIEAVNASTADAVSVSAEASFHGTVASLGLPATMVIGQTTAGGAAFAVDAALTGSTAEQTSTIGWSDAAGNTYGPLVYSTDTFVDAPAVLRATLADSRAVDADGNGLTGAGDTLGYSASVANEGSQAVADTLLTIPLDPGLSFVAGSVTATAGSIVQADDSAVILSIGTLAGFSNVTLTFEALTDAGLVDNEDIIEVQGTVTAAGLAPVLTDDPATAAPDDPTVTALVTGEPALYVGLDDALIIDADLNGAVTAGDTLRYSAFVVNTGGAAANGVTLDLSPDPGSTLVSGAVVSSTGTVLTGNGAGDAAVLVDLGHFPSLMATVIELDVVVTASSGSLSVQGELSATGAPAVLTDDPTTQATPDPTVTALSVVGEAGGGAGGTGGGGGDGTVLGPAPDVSLLSPVPGDRVGGPQDIVVDATATDGHSITDWSLILYPSGGDPPEGTELASGTGAPPASLGTFDPTLLDNGGWTLRVEVTDTSGVTGVGEASVVVDGEAKLGSFDLAFLDAEWSTPIATTSLLRTYRSIRKDVSGDFGHGWRLAMTDVRVQTNGPLGAGGWSQVQCGGGLIFVDICFETSEPHLVVVTWPDGRVDAFDFTPLKTSSFFPLVTTPAYSARAGTFSTLTPVAGDATLTSLNDGNLYDSLSFNAVYDPRQFWLTDSGGTRFLLDKADGCSRSLTRSAGAPSTPTQASSPTSARRWSSSATRRIGSIASSCPTAASSTTSMTPPVISSR